MTNEQEAALREALQVVVRPEGLKAIVEAYGIPYRDFTAVSEGEVPFSTVWRIASGGTDNPEWKSVEGVTEAVAEITGIDLSVLVQEGS